jgi:hypothetical protein
VSAATRVRLDLDQRRAGALHAALTEALNAQLVAGDRRDAARELLAQLDAKVPGWLTAAPIGGEAGYLIAAEAVLRALVDAEDRGRSALAEIELLGALGDAKPLGTSAGDVLGRMRREQLIRVRWDRGEGWWTAAPAGRRFVHRDTAALDDAWTVSDPDGLLDLIYAEHRPGRQAHRQSVQAIGRLASDELGALLGQLAARDLLDASRTDERWIELSWNGVQLARERWRDGGTEHRLAWDGPPPPPHPYRRGLPIRINPEDRVHPERRPGDGPAGRYCTPAAWLRRSSKTKLWATLRRDGAAVWTCRRCDSHWLVYLQAHGRETNPPTASPPRRPTTGPTGARPGSHDPPPRTRAPTRARRPANPPARARRRRAPVSLPGRAVRERHDNRTGAGIERPCCWPPASWRLRPAAGSANAVTPAK